MGSMNARMDQTRKTVGTVDIANWPLLYILYKVYNLYQMYIEIILLQIEIYRFWDLKLTN